MHRVFAKSGAKAVQVSRGEGRRRRGPRRRPRVTFHHGAQPALAGHHVLVRSRHQADVHVRRVRVTLLHRGNVRYQPGGGASPLPVLLRVPDEAQRPERAHRASQVRGGRRQPAGQRLRRHLQRPRASAQIQRRGARGGVQEVVGRRAGEGQGVHHGLLHERLRLQRPPVAVHRARADQSRRGGDHDGHEHGGHAGTHRGGEQSGGDLPRRAARHRPGARQPRRNHRQHQVKAEDPHRGVLRR